MMMTGNSDSEESIDTLSDRSGNNSDYCDSDDPEALDDELLSAHAFMRAKQMAVSARNPKCTHQSTESGSNMPHASDMPADKPAAVPKVLLLGWIDGWHEGSCVAAVSDRVEGGGLSANEQSRIGDGGACSSSALISSGGSEALVLPSDVGMNTIDSGTHPRPRRRLIKLIKTAQMDIDKRSTEGKLRRLARLKNELESLPPS
jgi:hypothetical protein